jgi:hypothetical protein
VSDLINVVPIKISKLDAARRQLVTAIRLYFANGDSVSTHTLAAAGFEILSDLDAHGPKTGTLFDHAERYIKPEYVDVFYKKLRKPQNFFKHADNDPEDILEFYPTGAAAIIWAAIEKYYELTKEEFLELVAFRIWIAIRNPNILLPPYQQYLEQSGLASDFSVDMRQQFFEAMSTAYARGFAQRFRSTS